MILLGSSLDSSIHFFILTHPAHNHQMDSQAINSRLPIGMFLYPLKPLK